MDTTAVILTAPKDLTLGTLALKAPGARDIVVDIRHSGISTGTEKLFWSGAMPPFPGMGYPLVPGYEAAGEVVEAGAETGLRVGEHVFVPGAACFDGAHGLFGGAASRIVTSADRVCRIDSAMKAEGALLALAATAHHALAGKDLPDLIVGHGTMGRLLARMTLALGGFAPTVWEVDEGRRAGAKGYAVLDPEDDPRRDYRVICDATGDPGLLNDLIGRCAKGGEIVLAGFYAAPVSFAFPPAFLRELRLRVAAEWAPADLIATRDLIDRGTLSLGGLITHVAPASEARAAYRTAFTDSACLKMILDWEGSA